MTLSRARLLPALAVSLFAQVDPIRAALDKNDFATAIKLLRPLADQGDPQAQSLLGELYASGQGTKPKLAEALALWRKAANQNFPPAQYSLGLMYATGQGVKRD